MYIVYVLKTSDGSFYIGHTADLEQRISRHNRGECRYTKTRLPISVVYTEQYGSRGKAIKREKQFKKWKSNRYIEKLIRADGGPIV